MKTYRTNEFLNYISQKYYNPDKNKIAWEHYPFPACIYSFSDPWFYTVGDILYMLRIMGFQIGFREQHYYFVHTNPRICPSICVGDRLIDVHYSNGTEKSKPFNQIEILFMNSTGTIQTVFIRKPHSTMTQRPANYKIICPHVVYIKIPTFSVLDVQQIGRHLKNVEYLFIDLQDNMGGSINDMLKVLSFFSNCSCCFNVEDSDECIHSVRIEPSYLNLSKLRTVVFQVNGKTASSAEMFLIMLRAIYPGRILGEKTMGKAVIQDFVRVNDYHIAMPVYHFQAPEIRGGSTTVVDDSNRIIPDIQGFLPSTEDAFLQAFDF